MASDVVVRLREDETDGGHGRNSGVACLYSIFVIEDYIGVFVLTPSQSYHQHFYCQFGSCVVNDPAIPSSEICRATSFIASTQELQR